MRRIIFIALLLIPAVGFTQTHHPKGKRPTTSMDSLYNELNLWGRYNDSFKAAVKKTEPYSPEAMKWKEKRDSLTYIIQRRNRWMGEIVDSLRRANPKWRQKQ